MAASSIETQEIRGINIKLLFTIIAAIVSSTIAIIMTINGLRTDIMSVKNIQERQAELQDLKMRTIDIRITNLEGEQKDQNNRIQKNEERLTDFKTGGR